MVRTEAAEREVFMIIFIINKGLRYKLIKKSR
jgi:hypothetical protein